MGGFSCAGTRTNFRPLDFDQPLAHAFLLPPHLLPFYYTSSCFFSSFACFSLIFFTRAFSFIRSFPTPIPQTPFLLPPFPPLHTLQLSLPPYMYRPRPRTLAGGQRCSPAPGRPWAVFGNGGGRREGQLHAPPFIRNPLPSLARFLTWSMGTMCPLPKRKHGFVCCVWKEGMVSISRKSLGEEKNQRRTRSALTLSLLSTYATQALRLHSHLLIPPHHLRSVDPEEGETLGRAHHACLRPVLQLPGRVFRRQESLLTRPGQRLRPGLVAVPVVEEGERQRRRSG